MKQLYKNNILIFIIIFILFTVFFTGKFYINDKKFETINLNGIDLLKIKNKSDITKDDIFKKEDFVFYGNYFKINSGNYELIIELKLRKATEIYFDIAKNKGQEIIKKKKNKIKRISKYYKNTL